MRRRSIHVVFVLALLACLFAASGLVVRQYKLGNRGNPNRTLASLQFAPDEEIAVRLEAATDKDDAASQSLLMLALAHDRPALRQAARDVLAERLDRWRLLPASESTVRVERLAAELCRSIDRLPEDSRPAAADIATQLLLWPVDDSGQEGDRGEQLVASCVKILRSVRSTRALEDPRATLTRQPDRLPSPASPERLR